MAMYAHGTRPAETALELRWDRAGARVALPVRTPDLGRHDPLDVRVAADPDLDPAALRIRLRDARSRTADVPVDPPAIAPWPAPEVKPPADETVDVPGSFGSVILDRVHARTLRTQPVTA